MLICPICNAQFKKIDVQHLRKHSISKEEYFLKYGPEAPFGYSAELKIAKSGENHPMFGQRRSEATKQKLAAATKKLWDEGNISEKQKNALGNFSKDAALNGQHFNKGKKSELTNEHREKLSAALLKHYESNPKELSTQQREKWHSETKYKISETKKKKLVSYYISRLNEWALIKNIERCRADVICKTCGTNIVVQLQTVRKHLFSNTLCHTCFPIFCGTSKLEDEVYSALKDLVPDSLIVRHNKTVLNNLELDFYLPAEKLAIEVNGLYWHSDVAGYDNKKHLEKTERCKDQGIQLIHILENEWLLQKELVIARLSAKLGKNKIIYARKCAISNISTEDKKAFLIKNHIQGDCVSSINLGLFFDGTLIAVMTFGRPRFNKKYDWELLRFATLKNLSIIGGASKLLAKFEDEVNWSSIISYSDRRWNSGEVYEKMGFNLASISLPSYWYFKKLELFHRSNFQKHKLSKILTSFDANLTEWENMKNNGYNRIWDCGNLVFVKNNILSDNDSI